MKHIGSELAPMLSSVYGVEIPPVIHTAVHLLRENAHIRFAALGASETETLRRMDEAMGLFAVSFERCESVIEQLALVSMVYAVTHDGEMPAIRYAESKSIWPKNSIVICPQFNIGPYRLDFLVRFLKHGKVKTIAVECDGKAYHTEREDMDSDAIRDGYMANIGIETRRYTGSHLFRKYEELQTWLSDFDEWEGL